ncbi:SPOR domain-containing protein [Thioalkalivibrio sp. HK1]|uniref:SPOR domain-containing protein n=1 Tax=Thioalkalivibrio sp. HK1 TaxID=1469245 RepID=UPI0004B7AB49|nr:SPOR domain-containing protein [Thioalkalivibrio sp. HK1]
MEERLKRRLVGAVVLVLAVVIFVPMFLGTPHEIQVESSMAGDSASKDSEGEVKVEGDPPSVARPAETVSIVRIASDGTVKHESTSQALEAVDPDKKTPSSEDDSKAKTKDDQAGAADRASASKSPPATPSTSTSDQRARSDTPEESASGESSTSEPAKREAAKNEPSGEGRKAGAPATPTIASPGGWVVQVGSFSDAKNAETLKEKFRKNGYRVFTVSGGDGGDNAKMTRVFVGSEDTRKKADALKIRIEGDRRVGIAKGLVRPWPEEAQEGR